MNRSRLGSPLRRRSTTFLVGLALLVTASPGAALGAANGPPKPTTDTIVTSEGVPATGNVLDNDVNLGGGTLTVTGFVPVAPEVGTLIVETNGDYTFTPADGWNGFTTTTYDVSNDSHTRAGTIEITVTPVNEAPAAVDDTLTIDEDTATDVTAGMLANDTDPDGDTLAVTAVSNANGGSAELVAGSVTFTPDADACGTALGGFDYDIGDGNGGSASAHATVDVTCVNDAPVAGDDALTVAEDAATDVTADLVANDTDADGDTLAVSGVANASGGAAVADAGSVTFTPDANLCGAAAGGFDYIVSDGNGGSDTGHATVDVTCGNDAPVASDDTAAGTEDTELVIADSELLANDDDGDADSLSVAGVSNPTGGAAVLDAGSVTFTPDPNLCGTAAGGFDYEVSDGNGGSDTGHVTVDLACVNDAPAAAADTATVAQGSGPADHDVLANDTDADGDTLTLVSASVDPAAGTASVVGGQVRFAPLASFSGDAVIDYVVSDGTVTSDGTLTVTVTADADAPVPVAPKASFGTGRVNQSAPLRISWSATDAVSGVASYEVQLSVAGGSFVTVYTGPATSMTAFYPFRKTLVWRVRATDNADNVSGWATSATRRIVPYQETNKHLSYRGTWTRVASKASSGTGYRYTTTLGKRVRLSFTGLEVLYVAPRTSASGYVKVYVDGGLVGRFRLRRATTALGQIIARATWSSSGTHVIRVVNDRAGRRGNLDAFIVLK